jgi:hypothetical protein
VEDAMTETDNREIRQIFVVMPFTKTPTRDFGQLKSFFESNIKAPIEREAFKYRYQVRRSDETFDITAQVIKDLYNANIVICDLSGTEGNPNVMYELGIRLALTNEPVILIREKHVDNKPIFDISGFYAHLYDPLNYAELTQHIIREIRAYEEKKKIYESPILSIARGGIPYLQAVSMQRADQLMKTMRSSIKMMRRLFVKQFMKYATLHLKMDLPERVFDFTAPLEYMEKNRDKFSEADWSKFRVNFGTQPTLDLYLSNLYLNGLVDSWLENAFTEYVITYHSYFVSTNYYHGEWNHMNVYRFLGETNILLQSTKLIRFLLKIENEKEKGEAKELFKEVLKSSQIYSFDDPNVSTTTLNMDTTPI